MISEFISAFAIYIISFLGILELLRVRCSSCVNVCVCIFTLRSNEMQSREKRFYSNKRNKNNLQITFRTKANRKA